MLVLYLLTLAVAVPLQDQTCGIQNNNQLCADGVQCCNTQGFCNNLPQSCGIDCDTTLLQDTCFIKHNFTLNASRVGAVDIQQCGQGIGSCPAGSCCNSDNICGTGDSDCDLNQGCQPDFSECLPLDYQCGSQFNNQLCNVNGWCCGGVGFCGIGDFYCDFFNGCQSNCTNSPAPIEPSTTFVTTTPTTSTEVVTTTEITTTEITTTTSSETVVPSTTTTRPPETRVLYFTSTFDVPYVYTQTLNQPPVQTQYYTSVVPIVYEYTQTLDVSVHYYTSEVPVSYVYTETL